MKYILSLIALVLFPLCNVMARGNGGQSVHSDASDRVYTVYSATEIITQHIGGLLLALVVVIVYTQYSSKQEKN